MSASATMPITSRLNRRLTDIPPGSVRVTVSVTPVTGTATRASWPGSSLLGPGSSRLFALGHVPHVAGPRRVRKSKTSCGAGHNGAATMGASSQGGTDMVGDTRDTGVAAVEQPGEENAASLASTVLEEESKR